MEEKDRLLNRILSLGTTGPWLESINLSRESILRVAREKDLSQIEHIYITGGGTSLYAGQVGKAYMEHIAGVRAEAVPCYYFREYTDKRLFGKNCCVVGISQTGGARSVMLDLRKARENGALTLAVTGSPEKEAPREAEYIIMTDAKTEGPTAKSTSYVQAILAVFLLAVEIGKAKKRLSSETAAYWEKQLELTISKAPEVVALKDQIYKIADLYKNAPINFVLGTGPNQGTAEEGALKIIEMAWVPAEAEELEDYLHGRYREVDTNTPMFLVAPKGGSKEKLMDAVGSAKQINIPTIVITDDDDPIILKVAKHVIKMPGGIDEYMTPMLYIIPLWLYGHRVGILRGSDPAGNRYGFTPINYRFSMHYDMEGNLLE